MSLAAEDIRFIREHLGEWLAEQSLGKLPAVYEIELRERILRVEEELKHQRELLKTILEQMDKRFGAVDKRFETLQNEMNWRFEGLTSRIDRLMMWSYATTLTVGGLVVIRTQAVCGLESKNRPPERRGQIDQAHAAAVQAPL